jgi:N-acetylglucosaminyl-diphospho-decaprenol L-rhamnosyltransferase
MSAISTVIVTHESAAVIERTLRALVRELGDEDEVIVVDNASTDRTREVVAAVAPGARLIEKEANSGFAAGCNLGALAASGELLLFLNPDAEPATGFREAIVRPLEDGRGWAAWQGLVTANGGRLVNTSGGVVHYTGIAWAGGAGRELDVDSLPAGEPGFVSGACLAVPRRAFLDLGGFPERYFLYHEDVDLSLRLRLGGGRLGLEPAARVDHEYEFAKGAAKWRRLERNRWATVIRTYPGALLALLLPVLLATELALIPAAALGGWLRQKLMAWLDTARDLPRLLRERSEVQARRSIGAAEFARGLVATLDSPYLGAAGRSPALGRVLSLYWSGVLALLRAGSRS